MQILNSEQITLFGEGDQIFFILEKKKNIDVANLTADRTRKSEDMNKYLDLAIEVGEGE